jgi:hypothetical protein
MARAREGTGGGVLVARMAFRAVSFRLVTTSACVIALAKNTANNANEK